jgi:carboxyl-terminal processing protease
MSRWGTGLGRGVAILLSLTLVLSATSLLARSDISAEQRRVNLEVFDQVWTTVRDRHWDKTLGGLDWDAMREEFRPRAETAESVPALRVVLRDMLGRLKQSHFVIHSPDEYEERDSSAAEAGRDGTCGFDVRVLDGRAIVTRVVGGSSAQRAGVQPGWCVRSIHGDDLAEPIAASARKHANTPSQEFAMAWVAMQRLSGRLGEKVAVEFLDGDDRPVSLTLPLERRRGHKFQWPNMPPRYFEYESRFVADDVGYIRFNTWAESASVLGSMQASIKDFKKTKGLVIDLRGSRGGDLRLGTAATELLLAGDERTRIGTMVLRDREANLFVRPRSASYKGRVAILVDGFTRSTGELFVASMRQIGRARVFGTQTAGALFGSYVEPLPNGDTFQFVVIDFKLLDGQSLEGVGLKPDIEVIPTRAELLAGHDPALERAIDWIQSTKPAQGHAAPGNASLHAFRRRSP